MLKSIINGARAQFLMVTTEPNTAEKIVMAYEHGLIVLTCSTSRRAQWLGHPQNVCKFSISGPQ
jgi:hypothetical protein